LGHGALLLNFSSSGRACGEGRTAAVVGNAHHASAAPALTSQCSVLERGEAILCDAATSVPAAKIQFREK